jgi:hypothetical protein
MTSTLPKGILDSVTSLLAATLYQGYPDRTTSFGISYHLRDKYSICRCWRNIATYKCKVHNGKIEIIYFVVEFLNRPSLSISRCRSRYEQTYLYLNLWYPFLWLYQKVLWNWYLQHVRVSDWQHICYFWWTLFQQTVGIPMGTNCPPPLAALFLYSYEADFIRGLLKKNEKTLARSFNFAFRYIDDVLPSLSISRCRSRYEQTYLYLNLWYPLFQAQCDRCDQQNHKT